MRYSRVEAVYRLGDRPFFHIQYYVHKLVKEGVEKVRGLDKVRPVPHHIDAVYDKETGLCTIRINLFAEMREYVDDVVKLLEDMACIGGIPAELAELGVEEVVVNPPQELADKVTVKFHSPTRFLNPLKKNTYDPFPHPTNLYVAAARAAKLLGLNPDLRQVVEASVKIKVVKFEGRSRMIFGLYKYLSPGYVGYVEYDLAKLTPEEKLLTLILTEIATHTGVGIGRAYTGHVTYTVQTRNGQQKVLSEYEGVAQS